MNVSVYKQFWNGLLNVKTVLHDYKLMLGCKAVQAFILRIFSFLSFPKLNFIEELKWRFIGNEQMFMILSLICFLDHSD